MSALLLLRGGRLGSVCPGIYFIQPDLLQRVYDGGRLIQFFLELPALLILLDLALDLQRDLAAGRESPQLGARLRWLLEGVLAPPRFVDALHFLLFDNFVELLQSFLLLLRLEAVQKLEILQNFFCGVRSLEPARLILRQRLASGRQPRKVFVGHYFFDVRRQVGLMGLGFHQPLLLARGAHLTVFVVLVADVFIVVVLFLLLRCVRRRAIWCIAVLGIRAILSWALRLVQLLHLGVFLNELLLAACQPLASASARVGVARRCCVIKQIQPKAQPNFSFASTSEARSLSLPRKERKDSRCHVRMELGLLTCVCEARD